MKKNIFKSVLSKHEALVFVNKPFVEYGLYVEIVFLYFKAIIDLFCCCKLHYILDNNDNIKVESLWWPQGAMAK